MPIFEWVEAMSLSGVCYSALLSLCRECMQIFFQHKIFVFAEFI